MKKSGVLVVLVVILVVSMVQAAWAAKQQPKEVLYYVDTWTWAVEKALPNGTIDVVWLLDWEDGDVSIAKSGSRIAYWSYTYDSETGIISWPISVVDLETLEEYQTGISGVPTLSPNGTMMAVTSYEPITVIIDGESWEMGANRVTVWNIVDPTKPVLLYTLPVMAAEENIQDPSWAPDGTLYCSVTDYYTSNESPDFYAGIAKFVPKKGSRAWVIKEAFSYFFNPEVSWDGKSLAYGKYNLSGTEPWSSIHVMALKGKRYDREVCEGYDFAFGDGNNIYVAWTYYEDPNFWEDYIVRVNVLTGQESDPIAWGYDPQVAVR